MNRGKVSASQTGFSHDDIREEDSLSNVTSTTRRRGSRSSFAKTRAKAARLAHQKRQAERVVLERQKLQAEVQLDETDAQLVHQKAQAEVKLKQQCTNKRTM